MIYEFSPKQDLHGYDKPWAPGAGKNLLENTGTTDTKNGITFTVNADGTVSLSGTASETTTFDINNFDFVAGNSYVLSGCPAGGTPTSYLLSIPTVGYDSGSGYTYDPSEDSTLPIRITVYNGTNVSGKVFKPMICLSTATNPKTFAPYENICPPEGFNIWDPVQDKMIQVYSGYVDAEARKLYLHPVYEEYDGEELVGPWMSSLDEYTEEGTPTTGAFVIDFGGEVTEYDITDFMLQTLLDSLGIRRFITSGAMLLNSLMDQAQGRVRSEAELLNRSFPIHVIAIGKDLPSNLVIKKPVSDVLPVLRGKTKFDRR